MFEDDYDEAETEARIERYHSGYLAHMNGQPRPSEKDAGEGWDQRAIDAKVRVVMPRRPEGYYHAKPGTFD